MNRFDLIHTPLCGRNLIEASAGTGKTFTIAGIYLRLVLETGLPVKKILVVTFTEAATKELKERVRKRLKEAERAFEAGASDDPLLAELLRRFPEPQAGRRLLSLAVRSFDEASIFTIHGFCQRMLLENPFESGSLSDTELLADQSTVLREIAQDYWRINCYRAPRARIDLLLSAGVTPSSLLALTRPVAGDPSARVIPPVPAQSGEPEQWLLGLKRGFFDYLAAELPKRKRVKNARSFDDLLIDLGQALTRPGSTLPALIRSRFDAALIDEFQDTDPTQFAIFNAIYPPQDAAPFFLIGDPKQAIYSFRGADIFAYLGAARRVEARHTLQENWRSEPELIRGVNALFARHPNPFVFEEIPFLPVQAARRELKRLECADKEQAPLTLWFAPRREAGKAINKGEAWEILPEAVASEIARLLRQGQKGALRIGERAVGPGDVAVLVRTNAQAKMMQRALSRRSIPSVLCSAGNLFDSHEAAELLRLVSAVAEPGSEPLLRGALATTMTGVSGDRLAQLIADENSWEEVLEEFRGYHDLWRTSGCMAMALRYLEQRQVRARLLALPMGERRLTNLLHLVETLHQAQSDGRLGMEGVIAWLAARIAEDQKHEEHEIRLETDEAAVQLVTIHKSKGLEYPIVFAPFCWAESGVGKSGAACFHGEDGRVVLDIGSPELARHQEAAQRERLAESLRLLYVALTRGKHRTYLVWGAFKDAGESGLHYLLHPDAESYKGQVALADEEILAELSQLALAAGGAVAVETIPAADLEPFLPEAESEPAYAARSFSGTIERDWRVASFTSLASRSHHLAELPDRDEESNREPVPAGGVDPRGIFAFPKGAKAGVFLHEVFEQLDFTRAETTLAPLVAKLLEKHGFEPMWQGAVCAMVQNVLDCPLHAGFTLSGIGLGQRFTELEFFFPLAPVKAERLQEAVSRHAASELPVDLAGLFGRLSFTPVKGMLRGFMDLVVEHEGRFYILDWKSNHLGHRVQDYDRAGMRREMEQNLYPLQYLLYAVALDHYLRLRIADYDYDRHFGGVYYVFLRGVDGNGHGIFADRPDRELIGALSHALVQPAR